MTDANQTQTEQPPDLVQEKGPWPFTTWRTYRRPDGSLRVWSSRTNLLGCVGFMVSAIFVLYLPGTPNSQSVTISVLFTLLGAIGFLVGSLLKLPETLSGHHFE